MGAEAIFFVAAIALAILVFGSISYAMTAQNPRARFWGCRIAAGFFVIAGLAFVVAPMVGEGSSRAGYLWGILMFVVAGWQWRLSGKYR